MCSPECADRRGNCTECADRRGNCTAALRWSLAPLALCAGLFLALWKFVWTRLPPFRWGCNAIGIVAQLLACLQVCFLGLTLLKMTWSLVCIGLCSLSDYVRLHQELSTFRGFLDRYYWPT